ncbi:MAG: ABC transporter ATP-binding protein [Candidatus Thorarchaeota archaeon]|jgi:branched-chain amino acid transport system ATP-binding protein
MKNIVLHAENMVKGFGALMAVNDVTISMEQGKLTLLMGPNGCGKTTLLNLCTGVLKADAGKVSLNGEDITGFRPHKIYGKGFVRTFQIPLPFQSMTVLDNVLAAMKSIGENPLYAWNPKRWEAEEEEHIEQAMEILGRVGLYDHWDKLADTLSGGHAKLLELARGLASGAKLIALDEPIGGCDPSFADEIFTYITQVKKSMGITFFVIEHRIDIAAPYADHAYVMEQGKLIAEGTSKEVTTDPRVQEIYIG